MMTKAEARKARKAGKLVDWKPAAQPKPKRPRRYRETALERCARLSYEYDRDF